MKLNVIEDWRCQGSGDCCRGVKRVSMTFAERRELEAQAAKATRRLQWRYNERPNMTDLVAAPCPFLDAENRCAVHDVRPYNCRRWGCLRSDVKAQPFVDEDTAAILRRMPEALPVLQRMQSEGQAWALAHNWRKDQQ